MFHVMIDRPEIPGNSGNAIRLSACTGTTLHLVEPLGFSLDDAHLRRAGLDYHDLARVHVHPDIDAAFTHVMPNRIIAFTSSATLPHTDIAYQPGDVLLFGPESVGLAPDVLQRREIALRSRIPMLAGRRSLNLANAVSIATYEAWRQHDFAGT